MVRSRIPHETSELVDIPVTPLLENGETQPHSRPINTGSISLSRLFVETPFKIGVAL